MNYYNLFILVSLYALFVPPSLQWNCQRQFLVLLLWAKRWFEPKIVGSDSQYNITITPIDSEDETISLSWSKVMNLYHISIPIQIQAAMASSYVFAPPMDVGRFSTDQ